MWKLDSFARLFFMFGWKKPVIDIRQPASQIIIPWTYSARRRCSFRRISYISQPKLICILRIIVHCITPSNWRSLRFLFWTLIVSRTSDLNSIAIILLLCNPLLTIHNPMNITCTAFAVSEFYWTTDSFAGLWINHNPNMG